MTEVEEMTGSELRTKYEAALEKVKKLEAANAEFTAKDILTTDSFPLVKPEDLEGVPADKIEEKATALQTERWNQRADLARDVFAKQGLESDELDQAVLEYMGGGEPLRKTEQQEAAEALESVRALGRLDSKPVTAKDLSNMSPMEKIQHGLKQSERKSRR